MRSLPIVRHVASNGPDPLFCGTLYGYDAFDGEPAGIYDGQAAPEDLWAEPQGPKELYGNHGAYVWHFLLATIAAQNAGFMLRDDAIESISEAAKSDVAKAH